MLNPCTPYFLSLDFGRLGKDRTALCMVQGEQLMVLPILLRFQLLHSTWSSGSLDVLLRVKERQRPHAELNKQTLRWCLHPSSTSNQMVMLYTYALHESASVDTSSLVLLSTGNCQDYTLCIVYIQWFFHLIKCQWMSVIEIQGI